MENLLEKKLSDAVLDTEAALDRFLTEGDPELRPLFDGMRYSTFAGGKRIRPFLVLSFCELFGGDRAAALPFAAAIEMIQTYSLIHDDLPCMDDDDYRRGRLTNHKVFGEAEAILAGDALLTLAFEALATAPLPPALIVRAVRALSSAAGCRGMVGGQMMDMAAEKQAPDLPGLRRLQERKTGALIAAAAELGCIAAGVEEGEGLVAARRYAEGIGRAFQITDDILDVYGDSALLGKKTGQDARDGKVTFLSFMTREEAYEAARRETEAAKAAVARYLAADTLLLLADSLLDRRK